MEQTERASRSEDALTWDALSSHYSCWYGGRLGEEVRREGAAPVPSSNWSGSSMTSKVILGFSQETMKVHRQGKCKPPWASSVPVGADDSWGWPPTVWEWGQSFGAMW